jgi:hypothetical protein
VDPDHADADIRAGKAFGEQGLYRTGTLQALVSGGRYHGHQTQPMPVGIKVILKRLTRQLKRYNPAHLGQLT